MNEVIDEQLRGVKASSATPVSGTPRPSGAAPSSRRARGGRAAEVLRFTIGEDGPRLDRFLIDKVKEAKPELHASRALVQRWIEEGRVRTGWRLSARTRSSRRASSSRSTSRRPSRRSGRSSRRRSRSASCIRTRTSSSSTSPRASSSIRAPASGRARSRTRSSPSRRGVSRRSAARTAGDRPPPRQGHLGPHRLRAHGPRAPLPRECLPRPEGREAVPSRSSRALRARRRGRSTAPIGRSPQGPEEDGDRRGWPRGRQPLAREGALRPEGDPALRGPRRRSSRSRSRRAARTRSACTSRRSGASCSATATYGRASDLIAPSGSPCL